MNKDKIGWFVRHEKTQLFGVVLFLHDDLIYTTSIKEDDMCNMTNIYRYS